MIELNLLPDVKLQFVHAQRARRRVISVVSVGGLIAVGLVVVFAIYVFIAQPALNGYYDGSIKKSIQAIQDNPDLNKNLTIQQQLAALPALHAAKPMYSRIISWLPTLNPSAPNSIKITRLNIDSSLDANTIVIDAYAPSYTAATVFESTLENAQFSATDVQPINLFDSVALTNTAIGQDATGTKVVTFTVTLKANDAVFAFDSNNASISVKAQDVTNSAQSVPADVFDATGGNQ